MSYIETFEVELVQKLEGGTESTAEIVRWVSEKVLESYRNGITAGQKGTQVKRQGQSRRRGFYGKAEYREATRGTPFDPEGRREQHGYKRQTARESFVEKNVKKTALLASQ